MPTIKATAETRARSGYAAPAPAFPIKLMFDNTGFAMRLPEIEMPMAPVVFMIGSSKPTPRPILSVLNQEQQPMMTAATGPQPISNDTLAELMEYTSRPIVLSMGGGGKDRFGVKSMTKTGRHPRSQGTLRKNPEVMNGSDTLWMYTASAAQTAPVLMPERSGWSGRRESDPPLKLGKLPFYQ